MLIYSRPTPSFRFEFQRNLVKSDRWHKMPLYDLKISQNSEVPESIEVSSSDTFLSSLL